MPLVELCLIQRISLINAMMRVNLGQKNIFNVNNLIKFLSSCNDAMSTSVDISAMKIKSAHKHDVLYFMT